MANDNCCLAEEVGAEEVERQAEEGADDDKSGKKKLHGIPLELVWSDVSRARFCLENIC